MAIFKLLTVMLACFSHIVFCVQHAGDSIPTADINCAITDAHVAYTLAKIQNAHLTMGPYPHTVIQDIFSPDIYECMLRMLPPNQAAYTKSDSHFKQGDGRYAMLIRSNNENIGPGVLNKKTKKWRPIPSSKNLNATFWTEWSRQFGREELKQAWLEKFDVTLQARSADWRRVAKTLYMRMELNRDISGYAIGPHTDAPYKWITMLYYLPKDSALSTAGTQVVRSTKGTTQKESKWMDPKDKQWETVKQAPFVPNTVMAFAICDRSWHAVPKVANKAVRDTIQTFIRGVDSNKVPPKGQCPDM